MLEPLRDRADAIVDSTGSHGAQLRRKIADELLPPRARGSWP